MVDIALLAPIIILVAMGAIDFSTVVARAAQLTSAVQEGVSYGRQYPTDTTNIRDHVKKEGPNLNLTDGNITVTCYSGLTTTTKSCSSATFGDSIKVQATYSYTPITGRLAALDGSPIAVTQSALAEIL
jgi:Flp pilus assembly protein TadG